MLQLALTVSIYLLIVIPAGVYLYPWLCWGRTP